MKIAVCILAGLLSAAGTALASELSGGAIHVTADEQLVLIPNSPSLNPDSQITLEAWFQLTEPVVTAGYAPVLEKPYTSHNDPR